MSEREEFEKVYPDDMGSPYWHVWQSARAPLLEALECERMRLVACGVVAISDTPESAASARDMHADYRSAACDDVARRVDECIRLRAQVEKLENKCALLAASWKKAEDDLEKLHAAQPKTSR
jgi:hypothetical protein